MNITRKVAQAVVGIAAIGLGIYLGLSDNVASHLNKIWAPAYWQYLLSAPFILGGALLLLNTSLKPTRSYAVVGYVLVGIAVCFLWFVDNR